MLQRYVPVHIFLARGDTPASVERALARFLATMNVSIEATGKPEFGSWFRKLIAKTQEPATRVMLADSFAKGRRALELQLVQKNQADIDRNQAEAAAALLNALKGEDAAVVQIGSIVVLKFIDASGGARTVVRSLTQREMIYMEEHPELLKNPSDILQQIHYTGSGEDIESRLDNPTAEQQTPAPLTLRNDYKS